MTVLRTVELANSRTIDMRMRSVWQMVVCLVMGIGAGIPAIAQEPIIRGGGWVMPVAQSRVIGPVEESRMVKLVGNTHPMARPAFDRGLVNPGKLLQRMVLVLKRSPEQEAALAAFNQRQYDPKSPEFHHWLTAEEFGKLYGPSDADITA